MLTKNLALIFLLVVLSHSKEVRLTCQTSATSECASGYKFRMIGASLDTKYCLPVGSSCNVMYDNTLQTTTCARDYKNGVCTTGVCYYTINTPVCSKDFSCTSTPDNYQYTCANCATINGCAKCFNGFKNGNTNTAEVCLGSTCTITNVNTTVSQCNNNVDALGFGCSCCLNTNQNVTACTSSNDALSTQEFTNWVIGTSTNNATNNSTTSGKFELNTQCIVVAILVILALIF